MKQIAENPPPTKNDYVGIDNTNKNKDKDAIIIHDSDNIEADCMSGLRLSSERDSLDKESNSEMEESDDNKLLIVGVRKTREKM